MLNEYAERGDEIVERIRHLLLSFSNGPGILQIAHFVNLAKLWSWDVTFAVPRPWD